MSYYRQIRKRYLQHPAAQDLVEIIQNHGFKIRLFNKVKRKGYGGSYCASTRTIKVGVRNLGGQFMSTQDFIKNLAHEVRHLLHDKEHFTYRTYYQGSPSSRGALLVGYRAEIDCQKWAVNYLKEHFSELSDFAADATYPPHMVAGYDSWRAEQSVRMREYWAAKKSKGGK